MNFIPAIGLALVSYACLFAAFIDFKDRRWLGASLATIMFIANFGLAACFAIGGIQ